MDKTSKKAKRRVVGVDCHPRKCVVQVTVGDTPGTLKKVGQSHEVMTRDLGAWCKRHLQPDDLIALEASGNSYAIAGALADRGFEALVLESAQVARYSDQRTDNDSISAFRIARCMVSGTAKVVWRPDKESFINRELLTCYANCVEDEGRKLNHIFGFLNGHAIHVPGLKGVMKSPEWRKACMGRFQEEREGKILQAYFDEYDHACIMRWYYYSEICRKVIADKRMLCLMRIQGIGVVTAFALMAIIGDIKRFPTPEKLCSYIGLAPHSKESGDGGPRCRGVGLGGRKDLRCYLTECGQSVLSRGKRGTKLKDWAMALFMRKGTRNIVTCAVARKLCAYVWHLLNGKPVTNDERLVCTPHKLAPLLKTFDKKDILEMGFGSKKAMLGHLVKEVLGEPAIAGNDGGDGACRQVVVDERDVCMADTACFSYEDNEVYDNEVYIDLGAQQPTSENADPATHTPCNAAAPAGNDRPSGRVGRLPASPPPTGQGGDFSPTSLGTRPPALAAPRGGLTPPSPNPSCGKRSLHVSGQSRGKTQLLTRITENVSN